MKDKRDRYEVEIPGSFKSVMRFPADNFEDAKRQAIEILNNIGRKKKIEFWLDKEKILVAQVVKKPQIRYVTKTVRYNPKLLKDVIDHAVYAEDFKRNQQSLYSGGMLTDKEVEEYNTRMKQLEKLAKAFDIKVKHG